MSDPYGVPTGVVPRVEYQPPLRRNPVARAAVLGTDPAQQVGRARPSAGLHERKEMIPALPPGYTFSLAKKRNLLLGYHATKPILYLDEARMEWRVLDVNVDDVPVNGRRP